ncbi:MAG: hypothetical protein WBD01_15095, partial [Salaquimonas sp.]
SNVYPNSERPVARSGALFLLKRLCQNSDHLTKGNSCSIKDPSAISLFKIALQGRLTLAHSCSQIGSSGSAAIESLELLFQNEVRRITGLRKPEGDDAEIQFLQYGRLVGV